MTRPPMHSLRAASSVALLALALAACGGDEAAANAATPGKAPSGAPGGAPGGKAPGGGPAGGGNRAGGSVVLSLIHISEPTRPY